MSLFLTQVWNFVKQKKEGPLFCVSACKKKGMRSSHPLF
jgi:hypothetical protein